jgi:trehalose 6-phosphate synthase
MIKNRVNIMETTPEMLDMQAAGETCESWEELLQARQLVIASNHGPVSFHRDENGELQPQRSGGGGLVTALSGIAQHLDACWIASALSEEDKAWQGGVVPIGNEGGSIQVQFVIAEEAAYDGYYKVIANPLLWFLQHSMWDIFRSPTIDRTTWQNWQNGYLAVNRLFAEAVSKQIQSKAQPALVMLQDYHLYVTPYFIRRLLRPHNKYTLMHFIHIPWPGAEDWGYLPPRMRTSILEGLCSVDLLGFQTREDGLNFIRTCESHLARSHVNFKNGRVWYRNHTTYVRDFPISIDVNALKHLAGSEEVAEHRKGLLDQYGGNQLIVRIDRTEPSKNIVRGFQAFNEMLELYPEHRGKVQFLALLVPSRMAVEEYQNYLNELMGAAGQVNATYGDSTWEPVRVVVSENYPRAVAAMQLYDVLLVNSIADGMNLVAKEGPVVNQQNGVLVLSEHTGARQQLESGALVIPPLDISSTANALHQALNMPDEQRKEKADRLRSLVEQEDIFDWLCKQLDTVVRLRL